MSNQLYVKNALGETAEIYLSGTIGSTAWGDGTSAQEFSDQLKKVSARNIVLRINSPGGNALEGFAMYNALKQRNGKVTVEIDGAALSAASVVAMAGDTVRMAKNAFLMIHNPSTTVQGEAKDFVKTAKLLDKVRDNIVQAYVDKSGGDAAYFSSAMADETWYTANEALEAGLIDAVSDYAGVTASVDAPWLNGVPSRIKSLADANKAAGSARIAEQLAALPAHERAEREALNARIEALKIKTRLIGLNRSITQPAVPVANTWTNSVRPKLTIY